MYSLAKVPAGRGQMIVSPTLSGLSLFCGVCELSGCVGVCVCPTPTPIKFGKWKEEMAIGMRKDAL